jgi:hypothetical protein
MMTGCPCKGGLAEEAGMLYQASPVHVRIHGLHSVPADSAYLAARDAAHTYTLAVLRGLQTCCFTRFLRSCVVYSVDAPRHP